MAKKEPNFYEKIAPVLIVVVVALAFAVGVLWQKVSSINTTGNAVANNNAQPVQPQAPTVDKLDQARAANVPLVSSFSDNIQPSQGQELRENDHTRGSENPEVLIIEYSDFECPFCSRFHPTVNQALSEYGDKVALVYRHFPLDSIHPQARPAAEASECVAELGGSDAFWQFADYVFENQTTALQDLSDTAAKAGVQKEAFDTCMEEGRYANKVESDYQEGLKAGVTGTPGNFVVNSKGEVWTLPGAVPYTTLKNTIDEALAS